MVNQWRIIYLVHIPLKLIFYWTKYIISLKMDVYSEFLAYAWLSKVRLYSYRTRPRTSAFLKLKENYISMLKINFGRLKKNVTSTVRIRVRHAKIWVRQKFARFTVFIQFQFNRFNLYLTHSLNVLFSKSSVPKERIEQLFSLWRFKLIKPEKFK